MSVKMGIGLAGLGWSAEEVAAVAVEADRLGYESIWVADHLVMPSDLLEKLDAVHAAVEPPLEVHRPYFDPLGFLCFLAGRTRNLRLGTAIWLMGLRHPFVAARAVQTLDLVSNGRAEVGVGAGWLTSEFDAVGLDFAARGRRLDECIEVCQALWSQDQTEHHGEHFDFGPVVFHPKPVQKPWPPLLAGGEEKPSLRRAARLDGWIGRRHTPETVRPYVDALRQFREDAGIGDQPFEIAIRPPAETVTDLAEWERAGVTRIYTRPWAANEDPIVGLRHYAQVWGLEGS
jgi:probable F420-dependent oxidoreductase